MSIAAVRQRLVLTSAEKRIIIFVVFAFLLGLLAQHHRATLLKSATTTDTEKLAAATSANVSPAKKRTRQVRRDKTPVPSEQNSPPTEPVAAGR